MITLEDLSKLEEASNLLYDLNDSEFEQDDLSIIRDIRGNLDRVYLNSKKALNKFEKEKLEKWNQSVTQ